MDVGCQVLSSDGKRIISGCAKQAMSVQDVTTGATSLGPLHGDVTWVKHFVLPRWHVFCHAEVDSTKKLVDGTPSGSRRCHLLIRPSDSGQETRLLSA